MFDQESKECRLVPVVCIDDAQNAPPLADAVVSGGLGCVEITLRTDAGLEAIEKIASRSDLLVGAGTVLNIEQAKAATDKGARFVVSPGISIALVEWCLTHSIPVYPGCATPSDIQLALELGLETIKFFPAEQLGGIRMLSALSSVFRTVKFMPTGGITVDNFLRYLSMDPVVACGGSWMVKPEWIKRSQFPEIRAEIARAVKLLGGSHHDV